MNSQGSRTGVATPAHGIAGSRLASLAVLQANFDRDGRSYLDSFVPFVTQALVDLAEPATVEQVQGAVARRFGLKIPQAPLKSVLGRASHAGVKRERRRYGIALEGSTFDVEQGKRFLRCHTALCEGLRRHAGTLGVALTVDEADVALSAFIDDHVAPLALASVGDTVEMLDENSTAMEFVVASYVAAIEASSPADFDYLVTLVKGNMLATAMYLRRRRRGSHLAGARRRHRLPRRRHVAA